MDRDELGDHGPDADGRADSDMEEEQENVPEAAGQRHRGEEEDDGEDLMGDNMWRDYEEMPHLDGYDPADLDDEADQESLPFEEREAARLAAERAMEARDRQAQGGLPAAFEDSASEPGAADVRRRRAEAMQAQGQEVEGSFMSGSDAPAPVVLDHLNVKGRVADWVLQAGVTDRIKAAFRTFLERYSEGDSNAVYWGRIVDMVEANKQSLEVDFIQLSRYQTALAIWVVDAPAQVLPMFNEVVADIVHNKYEYFLENVHSKLFVRIAGLPVVEQIRDIRHAHVNTLVKVHGVVTRRTGVFPQLALLVYNCKACGATLPPLTQSSDASKEVKPQQCPNCEGRGPFVMDQQLTLYQNYQKLTLQEAPGNVPAGRLPRSKNVILLHDLIDSARPGEEIEVTGIFQHGYDAALNAQAGFPVFATFIEANHIRRHVDGFALSAMTEEMRAAVQALAHERDVGERIVSSIAPSIYGHRNIKACIALALFGGQEKLVGSHRLRGDINVLLIGDPGTAKSQFLKYVDKTATRAIYTTGKGASAVGLTATVAKDPLTREWTLEGGALVLADRGICLIDEFDKMNEQDRVSIHEAMEQQSISISKAGIVTSLQARCAVVAAANPDSGRYDPSRTFHENVRTLTDPIISRFDCLCVVKDQIDPELDERLANFVVGSHHRSHPDLEDDERVAAEATTAAPDADETIPQDLLKVYIAYAKEHCHPKLQDADTDKMVQVYTELRREAAMTHAMPVAVRHLESMIRMSEAHARMHLRDKVQQQDIDFAIQLMLESFVQAQKHSVQRQLRKKFQRFMASRGDFNNLLMTLLRGMVRQSDHRAALDQGADYTRRATVQLPRTRFEERAQEYAVHDVEAFYTSRLFRDAGFKVSDNREYIVLSR